MGAVEDRAGEGLRAGVTVVLALVVEVATSGRVSFLAFDTEIRTIICTTDASRAAKGVGPVMVC